MSKERQKLPPQLYPYMFVVKEGSDIQSNLLHYKLQLLDLACREVLPSPDRSPVFLIKNPENIETGFVT